MKSVMHSFFNNNYPAKNRQSASAQPTVVPNIYARFHPNADNALKPTIWSKDLRRGFDVEKVFFSKSDMFSKCKTPL